MGDLAVLILAAGNSSRMGTPKQLLSIGNCTLLQHTISQVSFIKSQHIYVVLGASYNKISASIRCLKCHQLHHAYWELGLGSSIAYAIKELSKKTNYRRVLILLADQPALTSNLIQNLINYHVANKNDITQTSFKNYSGVPVVFESKYFNDLSKLSGGDGAKSVIKKYKDHVLTYHIDMELLDIDTPKDYQKYLNN